MQKRYRVHLMKILLILLVSVLYLIAGSKQKMSQNGLNKLLIESKSVNLAYPDSLFPTQIADIALLDGNIYTLNLSSSEKYPIVKFNKKGEFIKSVSRRGMGPGQFNSYLHKICSYKDKLVVFSSAQNTFYMLENDVVTKTRRIPMAHTVVADIWAAGDKIIGTCYGRSRQHLIVLDNDFNIENQYSVMPKDADITTLSGFALFYGFYGTGDRLYSHHVYPPFIYKTQIKDDELITEKVFYGDDLEDFHFADIDGIKDKYKKGMLSPIELMSSYSTIYLLYAEEDYVLGIYSKYEPDNRGAKLNCFVIHGDKLLYETPLTRQDIDGLFVFEGGLARNHFYEKDGELLVKLVFLNLDQSYLETL